MDTAQEIQHILEERGDSYSDKTFPAIARQWSAYLSTREDTDITLLPEDVARLMALFKKSHESPPTQTLVNVLTRTLTF